MKTKNRREFLRTAGMAAASVSGGVPAMAQRGARRPNVIILLVDDQGYGDLSCLGNPVLKTPMMDRLHGESVRFTDFHSAPMCTPTRGQLMSGMDAFHNRATATEAGRDLLRRDIPTMADIFAAGGYATAMFGKWHLGDSYPYRPMDRGFQEAKYILDGSMNSLVEFGNDYFDGTYHDNGVVGRSSGYCTDFWFGEAMKWMRDRQEKHEPFLLYLPTNAVHGPLWAPEEFAAPYRKPGLPAAYFGMVANMDMNLGRMERFLVETGLRENTIFIFMTDNGGSSGVKVFNAGMRGSKAQFYEGGHRVPCFVRWPAGHLRRPGDVDAPTQMQDVLPTLIELCGLKTPQNARFDGYSLAGLLQGKTDSLPDRMLMVKFGPLNITGERSIKKWEGAVIWKKWRLIDGVELYDLGSDPGQKKDVAAGRPDVVRKMRAHHEKWWAGVEPTLDEFSLLTIGSDKENPVALNCPDWQVCNCLNCSNLNAILDAQGGPRGGPWGVFVERSGDYEIALCRWPADQNLPLNAPCPEKKMTVATLKGGVAVPIAGAKLTIAGQELSTKTAAADKSAVFHVKLKGGMSTHLHGWFQDAQGNDLCGAYYAYVRRL